MTVAFISTAGVLVTAIIGGIGVALGLLFQRLARLEDQVEEATEENRTLWLWARSLVDYGYRWRREGSPEIPTLEDTISKHTKVKN